MEQASKTYSSHEGGVLLDPRFPSLLKDREDRKQRVSAQIFRFSTSGCSLSGRTGTGNTNWIFLTGYFFDPVH
jgi:hypothetical protein